MSTSLSVRTGEPSVSPFGARNSCGGRWKNRFLEKGKRKKDMFRMMELHLVSSRLLCLLTACLTCFTRENKQDVAARCPCLFLYLIIIWIHPSQSFLLCSAPHTMYEFWFFSLSSSLLCCLRNRILRLKKERNRVYECVLWMSSLVSVGFCVNVILAAPLLSQCGLNFTHSDQGAQVFHLRAELGHVQAAHVVDVLTQPSRLTESDKWLLSSHSCTFAYPTFKVLYVKLRTRLASWFWI